MAACKRFQLHNVSVRQIFSSSKETKSVPESCKRYHTATHYWSVANYYTICLLEMLIPEEGKPALSGIVILTNTTVTVCYTRTTRSLQLAEDRFVLPQECPIILSRDEFVITIYCLCATTRSEPFLNNFGVHVIGKSL